MGDLKPAVRDAATDLRTRIDVGCNDPDNGIFAGTAAMIEIVQPNMSGIALELEARCWWRPPRFVELPGAFRLAGKVWPVTASREWIGNWCWNAYAMPLGDAARFLIWLRGRDLFTVSTGYSELFEWWNGARELAAENVMASLLGLPVLSLR